MLDVVKVYLQAFLLGSAEGDDGLLKSVRSSINFRETLKDA